MRVNMFNSGRVYSSDVMLLDRFGHPLMILC